MKSIKEKTENFSLIPLYKTGHFYRFTIIYLDTTHKLVCLSI